MPIVPYITDTVVEWRLPSGGAFIVTDELGNELARFTADGDLVVIPTGKLRYAGTTVTSTGAELNILDGVTATAAELNILDGVTSTAAELNILDGVTSTATELNLLDGVTTTTAELNILDGVTSTFTELNLLDGVTSTTAELNTVDTSLAYADVTGLPLRVAQATWDYAVDGGAISAIGLGITIPANSIIVGSIIDVQTTCTSAGADAGTGALSVSGANDIVTAIAISDGTNPWDQGLHAGIPVFTAATAVKTTSAAEVTFTIAGQVFTAGKFVVNLFYIPTLVNV